MVSRDTSPEYWAVVIRRGRNVVVREDHLAPGESPVLFYTYHMARKFADDCNRDMLEARAKRGDVV